MGFADLLIRLVVAYDSEKALTIANRIGEVLRKNGWDASEQLARVRGSFPAW
jgi:ribonucleoside-diphosphate reductase alpha chain